MEINEKNLDLLSDENKFRFGYLCIKHVFERVKRVTYQEFKDSEEKSIIQAINLVEKWLKDPNSVNSDELENARDVAWTNARDERVANIVLAVGDIAQATWDATASNVMDVAWTTRDVAQAVSGNPEQEQRWQEKLLDYLLKQQNMDSNLENVDDPYSLAREIASKVQSGELKKNELGYRTQIQNYLNQMSLEDGEIFLDYLKQHKVYENMKKMIKEEILKVL